MRKTLKALAKTYRSLPWQIGDAMLAAAEQGDDVYGWIDRATGLSDQQLYDFSRLAAMWAPEERKWDLPWSYYRDAGGDKAIAVRLLAATSRNGWSRDQMRTARRLVLAEMDPPVHLACEHSKKQCDSCDSCDGVVGR